ncbi:SulP family inorganic anion transporter [Cellulomonas soli]|uniref:SulP family inorganic anion transporter n=1 Tax=Cellulomonas soli TaxID=931535 RepID=UPI003F87EC82
MSDAGRPGPTTRRTVRDAYGRRSPFASSTKEPLTRRLVPVVTTVRGYSGSRLRQDAIAGLTVAALALPAGMAYAELAGLPVTAGLYALLLPVLVYAGMGATRRGVIGPEGAVALLVASALGPLAVAGSPEYSALAAALAIGIGCLFLVARLAHLGWLADYFSQSVLVGYISGVAVLMALGQLSKLTGVSSDLEGELQAAADTLLHLGDANVWTVAVAVVTLVILVVLPKVAPRVPAALVVVVLGIGVSWAMDLQSHGVALTGPVPAGLPDLARPDVGMDELRSLVMPALAIFLVSFADAILIARSFAAKHRETVDADQELLAYGLASVASGFSHGMPIGASGSRTAVNDSMRATSQVSGFVAFSAIALILLVLTEPIQYLPSAVLGAVILVASLRLVEPAQWRALTRSSRAEVAIAAVTAVFVVTIGVLAAIAAAVVLSLVDVIRRMAAPEDAVLGWSEEDGRFADVRTRPDAVVTPGVVVYRIQGRLFFANAHFFKRRIWAAVDGAPRPVTTVVLDAGGLSGIDATAVDAVAEVHAGCLARNITLEVARATADLREHFASTGLTDVIGTEHFHPTVVAAVAAATA